MAAFGSIRTDLAELQGHLHISRMFNEGPALTSFVGMQMTPADAGRVRVGVIVCLAERSAMAI
jgi:hypothetical protein